MRTPEEIAKIRAACKLVSDTLGHLRKRVQAGVTALDLDRAAEKFILEHGGTPTFKGYAGFPAATCISVNHEIVHGIPNKRKFKRGDVVSVDVGVTLDGYIGDSAFTFAIHPELEVKALVDATLESLYLGIAEARAGKTTGDIGHAIQKFVEARGYNVVRELCGHGVGTSLHEPPEIPNFGSPGGGTKLEPGMVLAIEPMINLGTHAVKKANDGWTILTLDRQPSAHFEHTIVITDGEPEILTNFDFMAQ